MQRTLNNMQQTQNRDQRQPQQQTSPAYTMAARIRNEQGRERAGEYLLAMQPFLAQGEREHIAGSLDIPIPQRPQPQPQYSQPQQQGFSSAQFSPQFNMPNSQPRGGMNDPLQLMQLLSGLGMMGQKPQSGSAQASPMGANPLMLAQLLGSMMGKR